MVLGYRVVVWNSFQSMPVPYAGATLSSGSGVVAFSPFRRASGMNDVLLQCLFDRFGSVFPQCGLMVFPGVVIVSR